MGAKKRPSRTAPKGIQLLIIYSAVLAVIYLVLAILFPTTVLFGNEFTGPQAQLLNFISFFLMAALVFGFVHRTKWIWEYSIILYILSLTSSFFSILTRKTNALYLLADSILLSSLVIFIINGIIIWYLIKKEDYFKKHKVKNDHTDKVFLHVMTIFIVILFLVTVLLITSFYQNTSARIDDSINNLRGKTVEEALFMCANMDQPDRDLCFLTMSVSESNIVEKKVCDYIYSNFYRLTCYEALS